MLFSSVLFADNILRIDIVGNRKATRDTILFYMKSKPSGLYSEELLREDFRALWNTGFFSNIRIESEPSPDGMVVTLHLTENPFISEIAYKTSRGIKEKDITDKLQEKDLTLMTFTYHNPNRLKRAEGVIRDFLQEKGFNDGTVNILTEPSGEGTVKVTVDVNPGTKTRIGRIVFPGIETSDGLVTSAYLLKGMKNNREHGFLSAIGSKDVYNREKIGEDLEEVALRLKSLGYLEARVGEPSLSTIRRQGLFFWSKVRNMTEIAIPVELGPQYRVGKIEVSGNKVIRTSFLEKMARDVLQGGKVFDVKKRNKLIEDMRKLYGSLGYFYCQIQPRENLDPERQVADLVLQVMEYDVVHLGKLEFVGNTFTKDHVIRREWFLWEGSRLNSNLLEDCIRRMKQLGLVTIEEMPDIKPDPEDPQKIDITVKLKELNRQMINFNIGYSGYDGWFVAAGYSTQNFLGSGESLSLSVQTGSRAKSYRISFSEPYVFNSPATFGIDLYRTNYDYGNSMFKQRTTGFSLSGSVRFWRYFGFSLNYSFDNVGIYDVAEEYLNNINTNEYYLDMLANRRISTVSPTLYYNTVDSPIFPSSGFKLLGNYKISGSFLGGNTNMHRVHLELVKFQPMIKRHVLGFRTVYEYVKPFGDGSWILPWYQRCRIGGEMDIRGFEIYDVGPYHSGSYKSSYSDGGNKCFYMNVEYRIPLTEQFSLALFYDMGNAYKSGNAINFKDLYTSTGAEIKIYVPMLGVPFRLIFAYNPRVVRKEDSKWEFRFAIGPSFY